MESKRESEVDMTPRSYGTVLVVGGCGFLGSRLVDQLLNFPSEDADSEYFAASPQQRKGTNGVATVDTSKTPASTSIPTPNPEKYDINTLLPSSFPSLRSRYPPTDQASTSIHVLDLRCTQHIFAGATYHSADITDPNSLLEVFQKVKPDVVINTASPSWEAPPAILRKVNIDGTRTLLEVAGGKRHGDWGGCVKAFVHVSSASVIHDGESDLINADERYPYVCPNPKEYYSETKVLAEKIVLEANANRDYSNGGKMLTCAVRPAGIVGEGDRGGFSGGILRTASVAPDWQLHIQLGDNANLFDNTYVYNVCFGLLCAAQVLLNGGRLGNGGSSEHERVDGEAFNCTNNQPAFFWDSSRYLFSRYGRTINPNRIVALPISLASFVGGAAEVFNHLTGRKGKLNRQTVKYATISRYYSCEKLMERTGYVPVVGLDEGFARSVHWFKRDEEQQLREKGEWKKEQ
ncbi:uncharacterized protein Z520_11135 [Fonsecaea multimorphosa CBS 102226]|uniref:3-beta hydroxysteroid dehydrogenase/isomerase domain-containing protein n=1 Tax=Fonsecaea multimorphosa CBS 102226 TaxID=1442371 RepID=A0A0D2K9K4_9EURO|nr:uncharacterized protein Z520_11135 [Fonsecaea multimorphosa CBS 102226]KIX93078.1 hypothetical protein Z520_11135 [Fonsecaea multimorphosa CBS 102226]OAL18377.1 hypothetical protein AYO22_10697 [Fonsecaea multimorphosa]